MPAPWCPDWCDTARCPVRRGLGGEHRSSPQTVTAAPNRGRVVASMTWTPGRGEEIELIVRVRLDAPTIAGRREQARALLDRTISGVDRTMRNAARREAA